MSIVIRPEEKRDYEATEFLTREAFWDVYHPGCNEHLIMHKMRSVPAFIPELCLVADDNGKVVGNIAYTKAKVIDADNQEFEVLCMGPFSVLPEYQKQGIGKKLLNQSIEKARSMGYKAVIIFGNPDYYHKYDFVNAEKYGITTSDGINFDPFMALELFSGALSGVSGKFFADPVFEATYEEADEFDKKFPPREKHVTDTQLK